MYSPEIDPALIPVLYRLGRAGKQPMTRLVSELIYESLAARALPPDAAPHFAAASAKFARPDSNPRREAA